MGSTNNPSPWPTYNTFKDCSLGICSIYCPQWCYIVFPPPPPSEDGQATYLSPLVIAVIGILASALLLVTYYTLVTRYCRRRRQHHQADHHQISNDGQIGPASEVNRPINGRSGLDESTIKLITVYKYKIGDGLVEGTDCSVCLSEFEENESLRLLPKCNHAFHLPCIDPWLKSHASCPLCRSNISSFGELPPAQPSAIALDHSQSQTSDALRLNTHVYCHMINAPSLVIRDDRRSLVRDEAVINLFSNGGIPTPKTADESNWVREEALLGIMRRSVSLNSWICGHSGASSSDHQHQTGNGNVQFSIGIGSSRPDGRESSDEIGTNNLVSASPPEMMRSISTGRFFLRRCGPGRTSVLPS